MSENGFDYVIVGAGSAGCVLANRLGADGRSRVLLLEAGGKDRWPMAQIPLFYGITFAHPGYNWMYRAEPDPALDGRSEFWPRGKVLGGSSAINAMVYIRGHRGDFDDWRDAGNPGWGYDDVLPYFKKSEDHVFGASAYHGAGGELGVSDFSNDVHHLCDNFLAAGKALGWKHLPDFNGAEMEGFGLWQATIRKGVRSSTSNAFLKPAMGRPNLRVETGAHVTRILFEGKRAVGVEARIGGVLTEFRAGREVILSGGAINSPQLLQLSGVGDADLLKQHGIAVRHHAPRVGQGLQDHLCVSYFFKSNVPTMNDRLYPWWGKALAGIQYLLTRRGPLGMSGNQAGAFVKSRPDLARPNMHLYFNPMSYTLDTIRPGKMRQCDPFPAFLISFNTCRPTSRGHVAIKSADPFAAPAIVTNFLSTNEDIDDVYEGARLVRRIAAQRPLAEVIDSEHLPGAHVTKDADVLADFRARSGSVFHASCTCAMGPDAATSVVSPRLKVHGLDGLRVVDASVFPAVTSGNTNAPVIMVAEKGADMILSERG